MISPRESNARKGQTSLYFSLLCSFLLRYFLGLFGLGFSLSACALNGFEFYERSEATRTAGPNNASA